MAARKPRYRRWNRSRSFIRAVRIAVLSVVLLAACIVFYINFAGLPDSWKERIVAELSVRGIDIEVEEVKLSFPVGFSLEGARLNGLERVPGLTSNVSELVLEIAWRKLFALEFVPEALVFNGGDLTFPLGRISHADQSMRLDELEAELQFEPNGDWSLSYLKGEWRDVRFDVSGSVVNSELLLERLREIRSRPREESSDDTWARVLSWLESTEISGDPTVRIRFLIDALQLDAFELFVSVAAGGLTNDRIELREPSLHVTCRSRESDEGMLRGKAELSFASIVSPTVVLEEAELVSEFLFLTEALVFERAEISGTIEWAETNGRELRDLSLDTSVVNVGLGGDEEMLLEGAIKLSAAELSAPEGSVRNVRFAAGGSARPFEQKLERLSGTVEAGTVSVALPGERTASVESLRAEVMAAANHDEPEGDGLLGALAPFALNLDVELDALDAAGVVAESVELGVDWRWPLVKIGKLDAKLYEGAASVIGQLDLESRIAEIQSGLDFDVLQIASLLSERAQTRLDWFTWDKPPVVSARGSVELPAWDAPKDVWKEQVMRTARLDGDFEIGKGTFKEVPVLAAGSSFSFSNKVWRLPDIHVVRPEGEASIDCRFESESRFYSLDIVGQTLVVPLQPIYASRNPEFVRGIEESAPADLAITVTGPWHAGRGSIDGTIGFTNLTYRGEQWSSGVIDCLYTNDVLRVRRGDVFRPEGKAEVTDAVFHLQSKLVEFGHVVASVDPMVIARTIGPVTTRNLSPYQFATPPDVVLTGTLIAERTPVADMRFQVQGEDFTYWKFRLPKVAANLRWVGDRLFLTDVVGDFYGGQITGEAGFEFVHDGGPTKGWFRADAKKAQIEPLIEDVFEKDSQLRGTLDADLIVNSADLADFNSWQGGGIGAMTDGLVWDSPALGVVSPVLNALSPGLGNTVADRASGSYSIQDGNLHTSDLYIRGDTFGIHYDGDVDFNGNIDAVAETEIFENASLLGQVFDFAMTPFTKAFKYKLSGTIGDLKATPLYTIPRVILFPLRPIKTMEEVFETVGGTPPPDGSPAEPANDEER